MDLVKIKLISKGHDFRQSQFFINGIETPICGLSLSLDTSEPFQVINVKMPLHEAELNAEGELVVEGVILGIENEKRIYEQLKIKFETE